MSQNVENKVVEFQFNNSNFEKNVKTSMSTLEKLKNALNFDGAVKGFDKLDKATRDFDVSSMEKSVTGLGQKFSVLETMAVGALMKIGSQAVVAGEQLVKSLTVDQIGAGFEKYSQKIQAVATIMSATGYSIERVEDALADLNTYTDKTSYGFSQMVDNVGKFTSAGVDLEDSIKAMEGIGNWASLSGVTAASGKAGIAMYNLSQAMGQGYLLAQDWRSIENVNMATREFKQTLIDTAVALGELSVANDGYAYTADGTMVTAENLRSTLAKKWVNTDVIINTLKRYSDETDELGQKAYKAAAEARTLEDAIGAINDAISTSWMKSEEMLIGNYEEATEFWTGLQDYILDVFANTMEAREALLGGALMNTSWNDMKGMFNSLNMDTNTYFERLQEEADLYGITIDEITDTEAKMLSSEMFEQRVMNMAKQYGIAVDALIEEHGSLAKVVHKGLIDPQVYANVFGDWSAELMRTAAMTTDVSASMTELEKVARQVIAGDFGEGSERIRALNEAGYDSVEVLAKVEDVTNDVALGIDWLSDAQIAATGLTREEFREIRKLAQSTQYADSEFTRLVEDLTRKSGRELLVETVFNSLDALRKVLSAVKAGFETVFPPITAERLYEIIQKIRDFSERLIMSDENAEKLRKTMTGLFSIFGIVTDILGGAVRALGKVFGKIIPEGGLHILDFTEKIGDGIVAFREWLNSAGVIDQVFDGIGEAIGWVIQKVGELVEAFLQLPFVQEIAATIETTFNNIAADFSKWFGGLGSVSAVLDKVIWYIGAGLTIAKNWIKEVFKNLDLQGVWSDISVFFTNIWAAVKQFFSEDTINKLKETGFSFENLKAIFTEFKGSVEGNLTAATDAIKAAWDKITTWTDSLKTTFDKAIEFLTKKFGEFQQFLSDNTLGLIPILVGALGIGAVAGGAALVKKIYNFFEPLTGLINSFTNKNNAQAFAMRVSAMSTAFIEIAGAVAAVAFAMKIIDGLEHPVRSIIMCGIILAALTGVVIAAAILGNRFNAELPGMTSFKDIAIATVGMAASVLIMVWAMQKLATLTPGRIIGGLIVVSILMEVLVAMMWQFSRIDFSNPGSLTKGAFFAIAMAGAVKVMVDAIEKIGKMDTATIVKGLIVIGLLSLVILAISKVAGSASWGAAATILSIGLAFGIFAYAIKAFTKVPMEGMAKFFLALIPILFALGFVIAATKAAGPSAAGAGVAMIGIGLALIGFAKAAEIIASIPTEGLVKAVAAIVAFLGGMTGIIIATHFAGDNAMKAAVTVLATAFAVTILAGAMWLLSKVDPDRFWQSVIVIVALMGMIALVISSTKNIPDKGALGPLIVMTIMIGILIAGIIAIANFTEGDSALVAAASIGLVLLALAGSLKLMDKIKVDWTTIAQVGVMILLVSAMAALFALIALIPFNPIRMLALTGCMTVLLLAMSGVMVLLNFIGPVSWIAIAQLGTLMLLVSAMGALLACIAMIEFDPVRLLALTMAITDILESLCITLGVLALVGLAGPAAFVGIGALAALIVTGGGLALLLGWLAGLDDGGVGQKMLAGIDLMKLISTGLGEAIGGFIGGIFESAMSHLPAIADSIATFVEKLKGALKGVNSDMLEAASTLASVVIAFTVAEFLDGITKFISFGTSSLSQFGEELAAFGESLSEFNDNTSGISDVYRLKTVAEAAKLLAEMAASLPTNYLNNTEMEEFGSSLETFASHMQRFGVYAGNMNIEKIEEAAAAGQSVADFANSLAKTGGVLQFLAGETTSLDTFGEQLEKFGTSLVQFSTSVVGLPEGAEEATERAVTIGGNLNDLASNLQTDGGFIGKIFGSSDLRTFGTQIAVFGSGLQLYLNHIKDLTDDDVAKAEIAANVAGPLADLTTKLNTNEHWYDAFNGKTDLASWGANLETFGKAIVAYADSVSGIESGSFTQANVAINALANLSTAFSNVSLSDITGDFLYLKDQLDDITLSVNAIVEADIGAKLEEFSASLEQFNVIDEAFNATTKDTVAGQIGTWFEGLSTSISTFFDSFVDVGHELVDNIVTGTSEKSQDAYDAGEARSDDAKRGARSMFGEFVQAGVYVLEGFIQGLQNPAQVARIYWATYNAAVEGVRGLKDGAQEKSPSKAGYEAGDYLLIGFINAVNDGVGSMYNAAFTAGDQATLGLQDSVNKMQAILDGSIDSNPTITPVLDLSEIQNGANAIPSLFDDGTIYGSFGYTGYTAQAISGMTNRSGQTGVVNPATNNNSTVFNNQFTINDASDPRGTANEVSRILQQQIDKKESVWA